MRELITLETGFTLPKPPPSSLLSQKQHQPQVRKWSVRPRIRSPNTRRFDRRSIRNLKPFTDKCSSLPMSELSAAFLIFWMIQLWDAHRFICQNINCVGVKLDWVFIRSYCRCLMIYFKLVFSNYFSICILNVTRITVFHLSFCDFSLRVIEIKTI